MFIYPSEALRIFISELFNHLKMPLVHFILEIFLIFLIIIIWRTRKLSRGEDRINLTYEEEEVLINEWTPEPLVQNDFIISPKQINEIEGKISHFVTINSKKCLNLATNNFLDFVGNSEIEKNAIKCISKYAVGTCGPRGFYGTTDVHLLLEKTLARFCGTEEAIAYSYGFSTFSSAISSYSKRQDIIYADEGLCLPIKIGIDASRSKVYWFKHNDMEDLENRLKTVQSLEELNPKKFKNVRKFIIVEGIFLNFGDIVDIEKIIDLKYKYKVRIMIDESLSMGVLGKSGRGITEHFGVDINDIDLVSFSFENAFASVGGACIGRSYIIDHQRLSGLGYSFSASSPTFLCQAIIDELNIIIDDQERIQNLKKVINKFYSKLNQRLNSQMKIDASQYSPVLHLRLHYKPSSQKDYYYQKCLLDSIVQCCLDRDILVVRPSLLDDKEINCPPPSIRISLNCSLTENEIENSINIICSSIDDKLSDIIFN